MTLRDYFAAKAMAGLIASRTFNSDLGRNECAYDLGQNAPGGQGDEEALAEDAYRIADAMVTQRPRPVEQ